MPEAPRRWQPAGVAGVRRVAAPVTRGTAAERGYDHRWRKARLSFLAECPLCERCKARGLIVEATEVDHRTPHKGDAVLFWTRSNWSGLCRPCHSAKTATEDGGFGRPVTTRYGEVPPLPDGQEPF